MTRKKIAIVGSGISGMAVAYLLHPQHDITLYEKNAVIGGHSRTKTVAVDGKQIPVDTGFIVFNHRNYPHLTALFKHLNVATEESSMRFAISVNRGKFEWSAQNLNTIFGQRRNIANPRFYRMIIDVKRFFREAPKLLEEETDITLGAYLDWLGMGDWFRKYYLLPMGGAIWSCSLKTMMGFPAKAFLRFFYNHGLLGVDDQPQWHTVTGGSKNYISKLTASYADKIRVNAGVVSVTRTPQGVVVKDATGHSDTFDEIVMAGHADETLHALTDANADERAVLGAFSYQPNTAYLHSDESFMPKRKRCWASWVYLAEDGVDDAKIAITYWMNALQNLKTDIQLFVTLNPPRTVPADKVFDKHEFTHPVFNSAAIKAQGLVPALQGQHKTWYCGAWTRYGFHEDGLLSAVLVAEKLGVPIPWV